MSGAEGGAVTGSGQRVVVTGMGIVSSIGCAIDEARDALRKGTSGLVSAPQLLQAGLRCGVLAPVSGWERSRVPKKVRLTASTVASYAIAAAIEALGHAGLEVEALDRGRLSVVVGTAFSAIGEVSRMQKLLAGGKKSRAGAAGVARIMNSTVSGNIASMLGAHGRAYSPSTSFATGTDSIGHGYELIKQGLADVVVCGAAEEECWSEMGGYFDNLNLMSTDYNEAPEQACRPYDKGRQGLVMAAGAGIMVLESLQHAQARGAGIRAEVVGYGSTNDGDNLFHPTGEGLTRALQEALDNAAEHGVQKIDYTNTHGTGTGVGDVVETAVLREVLGEGTFISSTKGQTGHALGAAGAIEAVLALIMLSEGFVAPTHNLQTIDAECGGLRHVQKLIETRLSNVLSFSIGLGGTNSAVIWRMFDD